MVLKSYVLPLVFFNILFQDSLHRQRQGRYDLVGVYVPCRQEGHSCQGLSTFLGKLQEGGLTLLLLNRAILGGGTMVLQQHTVAL